MSDVSSKKMELERLKEEIKNKLGDKNSFFHEDWLHENEEGKIKGFLGASDLIIIGDRPATRQERDVFIDLFYETLVENHYQEAHLTDFIKRRGKAGEWSIKDMRESLPFLEKEMKVLCSQENRCHVICLGDKVYNWVCPFIISLKVEASIQKSRHYAYRFGTKEKREKEFKGSFDKAYKEVMK